MKEPLEEYRSRLARWTEVEQQQHRSYRQLGNARLFTGIAGVALAAVSIGVNWISAWWMILPVVVFVILAIRHESVDRALARARRGVAYYNRALARVENRWIGTGSTGDLYRDPKHVYADDLDLFGKGSLFELLSTARTATGERTLADWLLGPGTFEQIAGRQKAAAELRPLIDLREELAMMGDDIQAAVDDRKLAAWGARPRVPFVQGARIIAPVLAIAAVTGIVTWATGVTTLRPFLYVVLAEVVFGFFLRPSVSEVLLHITTPAHELELLALLLERIEREAFSSPALIDLRAKLVTDGRRATEQIKRLEKLVDRLDWARNQMFRLIAMPLVWIPQFAMAIEEWRAHCGPHIGEWVAAVGEFEALNSLATFASERPASVFPELLSSADPLIEAKDMAHPLISPASAVPNDVALGGDVRLWIVSGSNMAGKSTLLRSVGLNVVLALAGAPVTASTMRLSRVHIGASLSTHDSLADNRSRFYAEISRLRDIVELSRQGRPTFFLLDELLSGTNSHDRRVGAEALIKGLITRGAIGMVTTHDLALAEIANDLEGRAINVHFEDQLEGGEILFDYRLRPGVVARGNALELMRAVGLDV